MILKIQVHAVIDRLKVLLREGPDNRKFLLSYFISCFVLIPCYSLANLILIILHKFSIRLDQEIVMVSPKNILY